MKYLTTLLMLALCGNAYTQHKKAASAGGTIYPTQGALSAGDSFFFWDASLNATTNLYFSNLKTTLWTDGVMVNSFQIPNAAAPTVDAFGEIAGDNNLWAASRGTMLFYDGTAAVAMVATLATDVPTNGQVPVWNTGGTITWETPSAGSGDVATDTIWDAAGDTVYGTGANTSARLAAGTAGQIYTMNGGATAPSWSSTISVSSITVSGALSAGTFEFEGATADAFETSITVEDPTVDRAWRIPNAASTDFVGLDTAQTLTNKIIDSSLLTLPTITAPIYTEAVVAALSIDWQTATTFRKTLAANSTFTFANLVDGQTINVALTNTVGNYTVTWPTVSWSGGTAPTQTVGVKTDIYTFISINGTVYGSVVQNF